MIVVGIDPGLSGALVAIREDLALLRAEDTPTLAAGNRREYDIPRMADLIRSVSLGEPTRAVLEAAQAMPKQGVSSTFSFGRGYGIWLGVLGALEIPYSTVRPGEWTKILKGLPGKGKERSVLFASRTFPALELIPEGCKRPKDGRADAACMAYYGALIGKR